jgi:serine phosphatase RsbU (regulator of sigma subunit)
MGTLVREVVKSGIEQTPLQAIPEKIAQVEAELTKHIVETELAEKRLAAQHQVSQVLTHADSIHDAARAILRAICETLGWEAGLFWLLDSSASVISCIEVFDLSSPDAGEFGRYSKQLRYSEGEGFPGRVWAADRVIWIPDFAKDLELPRWSLAAKLGLHEAVGFPVRNGAEFLGVMEFFGPKVGKPNERLLQMMACIASQISQFIERRSAERILRVQDHDRYIAKQIQDALLPTAMPEMPGFKIAAKCVPATAVGGDCFDFIPMPVECQQCLGVVVGDASGHGIGAALLITETRAYLRALALTQGDVGSMLSSTNARLSGTPTDHFVTLLLARLNPQNRTLTYAGAGHCPGYVLDSRGNTKAILASTGAPLGVDVLGQFPASSEIVLAPKDLVVLFTDGIIEARSSEGQAFGLAGVLDTVGANRHRPPKEILEALFQAVKDHTQRPIQDDDATAVIVKVEASAEAG